MVADGPTGCSFSSLQPSVLDLKSLRHQILSLQSVLSSGWVSLRNIRLVPHLPTNRSFSRNSLAYMHASTQYIKQVSSLLKVGVTSLRSRSSNDAIQGMEELRIIFRWAKIYHGNPVRVESYSCKLRLKSSSEKDAVRMQPGSNESYVLYVPAKLNYS